MFHTHQAGLLSRELSQILGFKPMRTRGLRIMTEMKHIAAPFIGGSTLQSSNNDAASSRRRHKYPDFQSNQHRMDTFVGWPCSETIEPLVIAKAGFFYAGYSDCVRCFSCGGELRNWEYGDEPWEEHARWFPECMFLREQTGEKYTRIPSEQQAENVSIDKRCMGPASGDQCERNDPVSQPDIPDPNLIYRNSDYVLPEETSQFAIACLNVNTAEDKKVLEENRRLKELITCKICLDHEAYIVFLPCGHLVSCQDCARMLETCAVCRATIQGKVMILTCDLLRN
ncbi:putative inhibitor of apoptosis [Mercenaria mercenaria]|uniref:putative inhibitor of apoptosis n=1 Tax=Mercenaria mercenaria TaxID=6596 RepID=UPI00234ED84D|nr:putative inhibitor of apoptosis [Mercenaria mercenaria]